MFNKLLCLLLLFTSSIFNLYSNELKIDIETYAGFVFDNITIQEEFFENQNFSSSDKLISQNRFYTYESYHNKIKNSIDGNYVFVSQFNFIDIYEIKSGIKIDKIIFSTNINDFCLSLDGKMIAVGTEDGITILELLTQTEILYIPAKEKSTISRGMYYEENNTISPIGFNNESNTIVEFQRKTIIDRAAEIIKYEVSFFAWDIKTGEKKLESEVYKSLAFPKFAYDPFNDLLYVANSENSLSPYDIDMGKKLSDINLGISLKHARIAIQPFTNNLICNDLYDLRIINLKTGKTNYIEEDSQILPRRVNVVSDGEAFFIFSKNRLQIKYNDNYKDLVAYDLNSFEGIFKKIYDTYIDYAVSNDLKNAVIVTKDGLMFADLESKKITKKISANNNRINVLAYSESSKKAALLRDLMNNNKQLEIWDLVSKRPIKIININNEEKYNVFKLFFDGEIPYIAMVIEGKPVIKISKILSIFKVEDKISNVLSVEIPAVFQYMTLDAKNHRILMGHTGHFNSIDEIKIHNGFSGDKNTDLLSTIYAIDYENISANLIRRLTIPDRPLDSFWNLGLTNCFPIQNNSFIITEVKSDGFYTDSIRRTKIVTPEDNLIYIDKDILGTAIAYIWNSNEIIADNLESENYIIYNLARKSPVAEINKAQKILLTPDETKCICIFPERDENDEIKGNFLIYNTNNWKVLYDYKLDVPDSISAVYLTNDTFSTVTPDGTLREFDLNSGLLKSILYTFNDGNYYGWDDNNKIYSSFDTSHHITTVLPLEFDEPTHNNLFDKKAIVNDGYLYVRALPFPEAEILGRLATDESVKIIRKSTEKVQISDMNDYWYLIESNNKMQGWCFGYFLDIEY